MMLRVLIANYETMYLGKDTTSLLCLSIEIIKEEDRWYNSSGREGLRGIFR